MLEDLPWRETDLEVSVGRGEGDVVVLERVWMTRGRVDEGVEEKAGRTVVPWSAAGSTPSID